MHYLLILFTTVLFSFSNIFSSLYQKNEGDSLNKALKRALIGAIFSIIMLVFMGIGNLSFSLFSFIIALFAAVDSIVCTVMTIKVLAIANLTVYSLYLMIGGMLLPFVFSIAFYDEVFTIKKMICVFMLVLALLVTNPINKKLDKKNK